MTFNANKAAEDGFESAVNQLTPLDASAKERQQIRDKLSEIVSECGPVINGYPSWHPFLMESDPRKYGPMVPNNLKSFTYLDHTVYLVNGIITCPYPHAVVELFKSIELLKHPWAQITIEKIDSVVFHSENAVPILIRCEWDDELNSDGTISIRAAVGALLDREIPNGKNAVYAESWERMKADFLGEPHGARSSLFVNQKTGHTLKTVWNMLVKTGVLGKEYF